MKKKSSSSRRHKKLAGVVSRKIIGVPAGVAFPIVGIATLFLDKHLNVRRFTPQAKKIIKLIAADVGRPITDLATDLRYPELAEDAQAVLQKLIAVEKAITARDGRWFNVRIMPYRTMDDRIDGVVITFANITEAKTLEAKLRGQHAGLKKPEVKPSGNLKPGRTPKKPRR